MNWTGVFPAVTTKMSRDGVLDVAATQSSVDRLIVSGVSGIIMLPMLGENASLTQAERDTVVSAARETVGGRVPMLTGLAELSTEDAVGAARHYKSLGSEGLMVFPSLAYRTDRRETVTWFSSIAAASDLPIMIYNNPIAYRVDVDIPTLEQLTEIDSIICIKEETGNTHRVTDVFNAFGDRYSVFCGIDNVILESIALGVTGWVSGMCNVWPAECVKIFNAGRAGEFREILPLLQTMTPAFHLDTDVKLVQYIKLAENIVCGSPDGVRLPRMQIEGNECARVEAVIRKTIADLQNM